MQVYIPTETSLQDIPVKVNGFMRLLEQCADGIAIMSADRELLYISSSVKRILGYTAAEVMRIGWFTLLHPDDVISVTNRVPDVLNSPGALFEGNVRRMRHKDGTWRWIEATITNMLHDHDVNGIVNNFRDITEKKEAQEKLIHANRLYAFLSHINQAIVHVRDGATVFKEACRIATEVGKFRAAWIGLFDQDEHVINVAAECGIEPVDMPLFNHVPYSEHGPQYYVLSTGAYYVCNSIQEDLELQGWKEFADNRGYCSCMVLPIRTGGKIIGTFNLYAAENNFFNAAEIALLDEATRDISFALDVFEKENKRLAIYEKHRHGELRLKQAQAIAHLGSWEYDLSKEVITWSDEGCKIYGLSSDENRQSLETWHSFIHPDDYDFVVEIIKNASSNLTDTNFFHRIVRRDGSIRHLHAQSHFEFNNEGIPVSIYGVSHDVTGMKESEEALRQSEANLRVIIDLIPQPIAAKDYDGTFVFANDAYARHFGLNSKQLVYKTMREAIPVENEYSYFLNQDRTVIEKDNTMIFPEIKFVDAKGKLKMFHTTKVPYMLPGENKKVVLSISQDITEQKKSEEERTKMIADIVQRNKDLEQFSYVISHNMRAPVANILGLNDLLHLPGSTKEDEQVIIDGISTSVKKLDDVIRDLNYILQVRHNVNEIKELVHFSGLVSDIKLSINDLLVKEEVSIITDFSAVENLHSLKSYLYSIFFNLISNSIKYRRQGIKQVIEIKSVKRGNSVDLIFKDNGLGIDLENCSELFGLYKRFHYHTEGKGVGLYMVKTQVETLGGKISVDSIVYSGTIFTITFETDKSL